MLSGQSEMVKWRKYNFDPKLAENIAAVTIIETYSVLKVRGQIRNMWTLSVILAILIQIVIIAISNLKYC